MILKRFSNSINKIGRLMLGLQKQPIVRRFFYCWIN